MNTPLQLQPATTLTPTDRLLVWDAAEATLLADRRVEAGRVAVLLPDGLIEVRAGRRTPGVDPLQVVDPIAGTHRFGRWLANLEHRSGVLELPQAWVQSVGVRGFLFVRRPSEPAQFEDLADSSTESLLVFDAMTEKRLAWLRMAAVGDSPGAGEEQISSLDLVGTARVTPAGDAVVWATRRGRVLEWDLGLRR